MKFWISLVGLCTLSYGVGATLWPIPQMIEMGQDTATVSSSVDFKIGCSNNVLQAARERYLALIKETRFVSPRLHAETPKSGNGYQLTTIHVEVDDCDGDYPEAEVNEWYELTIPAPSENIQATIKANTTWGALRAMETFSQLCYFPKDSSDPIIEGLPVSIRDGPAYSHRGLLLDTARNFFPVEDIKRTLDAMSYNKLNVLHWHLVDSQSWPVESKFLPELAKRGSYGPSMTYSHKDVGEIIEYGKLRGIRIIPEFDMPGHQGAVALVNPEITSCYNEKEHWLSVANEPPSGQLNPFHKDTDKFVKDLTQEYAALFPDSYFHTGADEVNGNCWFLDLDFRTTVGDQGIPVNTAVGDYIKTLQDKLGEKFTLPKGWDQKLSEMDKPLDSESDIMDVLQALKSILVSDFNEKVHGHLKSLKKVPMVWEEAFLIAGSNLPNGSIVQMWLKEEELPNVVKSGYRVVASPYFAWYLDCGLGNWVVGGGGYHNSWCEYNSWERMYSYDPARGLSEEESKLVIGGEVCMWTEQVDSMNLDSTVWPRAAAVAEVLWSGKGNQGRALSSTEALPRLQDQRFRMVARGIRAAPLQPLWCARNPGECDMMPQPAPEPPTVQKEDVTHSDQFEAPTTELPEDGRDDVVSDKLSKADTSEEIEGEVQADSNAPESKGN
ncbi:Glucosamine-6-phosphate isomerase (Glucosamine-6-phosphate deaminase) (GNPDA) (GlcN6P deaminase) [Dispira parvispora]|uniref:Beta-hexosaminidase n=1 Tax=Dispira parvispora TaxID=1520584 RepID=A0A9W8AMF8_9FUNG|nr:Glucosamine-6-phosphate isomerase (Glucosamine-6-phosphate deaminase) (GNPDA) (GlcN6P deaminase) [Dispira parvispora]